ncbi:PepSY-like domain-containing protein [Flavobacterium sp. FlaQc-52]|jgi:phosphopantothenoylcysteine synthetase/decarboxylase|uniref:PepSY-like domain-containing protein n=1 Tax=Flavobacterium cupriresistens TaxID=2893885 RepID=A0ABU4RAC1_9FLAO|nr:MULTISPECIES: PepSY-like domain-containing protein [unclassified Flavobacterium]MDX6189509.1 PepSY-like domain-containing protein [Flavobacterium sp. Fl-318]UFH41082.1 PepSY-like domain-containing protein [Flavobacterium sp. F-323]
MKIKIIFATVLLGFAISANAQKRIKITELPEASQDFLKKHFSYTTVEVVKKDAEHGEKGYEVILKDGTEVEFWKDGSYREVDGGKKPIPTAFIPAAVKDYVAKNYPNEKITHIDYGHKDLDVDLTNKIDLEFTKEGKLLKGKKE